MKSQLNTLALSQVDRRLSELREVKDRARVSSGWIKYMRTALGITLKELAAMVGVTTPTVAQAERNEVEGKLTLATLKKMAEAMECEFVYSFVPKKSVSETIHNKAVEKARKRLNEAGLHMKLEAQGVDGNMEERVERLAQKFIDKGDVW